MSDSEIELVDGAPDQTAAEGVQTLEQVQFQADELNSVSRQADYWKWLKYVAVPSVDKKGHRLMLR